MDSVLFDNVIDLEKLVRSTKLALAQAQSGEVSCNRTPAEAKDDFD